MFKKIKLLIKKLFNKNKVMKKMYKFQHITHLKDFIYGLKRSNYFTHNDVLEIYGTPKLHGTNASIVFYKDGSTQIQSRNNILNQHQDNMDFYKWMNPERVAFIKSNITELLNKYPMVIVYGEYAGKAIQKNMAISEMERFFAPFAIRLINDYQDFYIVPDMKIFNEELRIFDLFKTEHKITIDKKSFDDLSFVETIDSYVKQYETQDVFAKKFGYKGVGEGIVWHYIIDGAAYFFKTKIDEFQTKAQKVNKDKSIEEIKEDKRIVEYCLNEARLKQGLDYLKENNLEIDLKNIKPFIDFIVKDVLREERRFLEDNAITDKRISKIVGSECANWFKRAIRTGDFQ